MTCKCGRKHRVNETQRRSLLKSFVIIIISIIVDTLIVTQFNSMGIQPLFSAITIEGICLFGHFLLERGWNKISWGREVKTLEVETKD